MTSSAILFRSNDIDRFPMVGLVVKQIRVRILPKAVSK
jgi:hypothetical protein